MTHGPWRLVFMGSPEFAAPSLQALAAGEDIVEAVVTQPDRPQGRGRQVAPPPVKTLAQDLGLPVWQPSSIKAPDSVRRLAEMAPDLLVVVAFGQLLSQSILDIPRAGTLNVHPSLLPKYRGPAPINWAVINGESKTGVTTMFLDEGVDTGPILLSRETEIGAAETAGDLHDRLAVMGADLLLETIAGLKAGTVSPTPQPEEGASRGRLLTKADGRVDWTRPAEELSALIRGMDPWPGAYAAFRNKTLKLFGARAGAGRGRPGQVLALHEGWLHVAAGAGSVGVSELQLAGKKRQGAEDFWRGQRLDSTVFFE